MGPDAELGVAEPFRNDVCLERFACALEFARGDLGTFWRVSTREFQSGCAARQKPDKISSGYGHGVIILDR